ncbi:MAG TPA: hypothetical protein VM223_25420 [Planctomycetota bacterium]|nr:hypothetical protein [Planctomycetota bacterium]
MTEADMAFGRMFTGEDCSCCGKRIPHGEHCVRVTIPEKPPRVICTACVYELAGRLIAQMKAEATAPTKAAEKKNGKKK